MSVIATRAHLRADSAAAVPQLRCWNGTAMIALPCTECVHGALMIICTMSGLNACRLSMMCPFCARTQARRLHQEKAKFRTSLLVTKTQQMVGM